MNTSWLRPFVCALGIGCLLSLQACGPASVEGATAEAVGDKKDEVGRTDSHEFHDAYSYKVYVPAGYKKAKEALPLMVFLQGCASPPYNTMGVTDINEVADAERFLVLYPENAGQCWRAATGEEDSIHRGGGGDADQIAGMTLATMQQYKVDPEQVYLLGGSAGGFQSSATAAAYPDLYAAYGIIAGGGYGQNVATCAAMPDRMLWVFAQQAIAEMGERARVMPLITIGGVGALDPLGEDPSGTLYSDPRWTIGGCTGNAFLEGMAINNLLTGGDPTGQFLTIISDGRFNHDTVSNERGHVLGGFGWTKEIWRDPAGCRVGERWRIEQMGHTYPGGTAEPKAPSAARAAWEFFRRYRKSETGDLMSANDHCTESVRSELSDGTGHVDTYTIDHPVWACAGTDCSPLNPPYYSYKVYVPGGRDERKALPLMVFLHGCNSTASGMIKATLLNVLADEKQFLVLYPNANGQCWRAASAEPDAINRDFRPEGKEGDFGGEADVVAEMTRLTMQRYNVDPERVYVWGGSAGGLMSADMAATYPDLYAAYGIIVGGGYAQHGYLTCVAQPNLIDGHYAELAVKQMAERARVMPLITFGGVGGADPLGEDPTGVDPGYGFGCTSHAWTVGMGINNLLTGGTLNEVDLSTTGVLNTGIGGVTGGRFSPDPSSAETGQVPHGFSWSKEVWRDPAGCRIGERWKINGMGHTYPGGQAEPRAPDSGRAAWEFFSRYRKSDTGNACAESQP
jgi:poly(3-hydroxybutyrate) depolymerase